MQKTKFIKEVIGKVLEPEGFIYDKEIKSWGFLKVYKNCKGELSRQTVTFDMAPYYKYKLRMFLNCFCGIYNSYGINSFVPDCCTDGVEYQSEDDFPEAVKKCAEILNRYGIKFLKSLENPENDEDFLRNEYFRQEDYYLLYEKHDHLAKKFIKENKIDESNIIIDDAFNIVKDFILRKQDEPFAESRDSFIELAAFYGYILNKTEPYHWEINDFKTHEICTLASDFKKSKNYFITRKIYFAWKGKEDELDELKELNVKNTE